MSYNVFVDDRISGKNLATFNMPRAYDASAVANHFVDAGFRVDTDLWGDVIPDAMMSPDVAALAEATLPVLPPMVCSLHGDGCDHDPKRRHIFRSVHH